MCGLDVEWPRVGSLPSGQEAQARLRGGTWGGLSGKERTALQREASRTNGTRFGRPHKVDDADAAKARQLREKGIAATDIAKMLGVSRATAYRYLSDGVPLSA